MPATKRGGDYGAKTRGNTRGNKKGKEVCLGKKRLSQSILEKWEITLSHTSKLLFLWYFDSYVYWGSTGLSVYFYTRIYNYDRIYSTTKEIGRSRARVQLFMKIKNDFYEK